MTDEYCRVMDVEGKAVIDPVFHQALQTKKNVFAIGDCATQHGHPMPSTAQVAQQEGKYIATLLNSDDWHGASPQTRLKPFKFHVE